MKLVYGVGINDMPKGSCSETVYGKSVLHLFYIKWRNMLIRCYSAKFHKTNPAYIGCSVCEEWKTLSKFKEWLDRQPLERHSWSLDKDLLFTENHIYSPETCILVPSWLNNFVIERGASRGKYMIGVYWNKQVKKFQSSVKDGTGRPKHLGLFTDELSAHLAWKAAKLQIVHDRKDELNQIDHRLYDALVKRYS